MILDPRFDEELKTSVIVKELVTDDGYRLSLRVHAHKGKKAKYMRELLPHLFTGDSAITEINQSLPHLLGDQAVDLMPDNISQIMKQIALNLHKCLVETWGLAPIKRWQKWNIHFSLLLTNPRGLVVSEQTVLNWSERSMSSYLKLARKSRKLTTQDELLSKCLLISKT